jgi:hypothetical protein
MAMERLDDTAEERGELPAPDIEFEPPCRHCEGNGSYFVRTDVDDEREIDCSHCSDLDDGPDADRDDADGDGWANHADLYETEAA